MMLAREFHWTFQQIGEMTPGQIYIAISELTGPSKVDPRTGRPVDTVSSLDEALAYQQRIKEWHHK